MPVAATVRSTGPSAPTQLTPAPTMFSWVPGVHIGVVTITNPVLLSGVAGAELEADDAGREIAGLCVVACVGHLELDQVRRVAVDAAGTGLGVRATDSHDVLGAVLAAKLDPAEAAEKNRRPRRRWRQLGVAAPLPTSSSTSLPYWRPRSVAPLALMNTSLSMKKK